MPALRMKRLKVALALVGLITVTTLTGCAPPAVDRPVPSAVMTGPVTGGRLGFPFTSMRPDVAKEAGYVEEEYYASGTALAYASQSLPTDGRWSLSSVKTAEYTTRILVRRPLDLSRFSGNVVVEWFNVSGGVDVDPDFGFIHPEVFRNGDIYVGVSAQYAGIDNPLNIKIGDITSQGLKQWDPVRYALLHHPGDEFSYDMFSQIGQALRSPSGADVLHGVRPKHLIAVGESQSAIRMFAYVNGVQPLAGVYDGFIIHSRAGWGFGGFDSSSPVSLTGPAHVRTDLDAPVIQIVTETDLILAGNIEARQPDNDKLRTWEIAGTAHADKALLDYQLSSVSRGFPGSDVSSAIQCPAMNDGPQQYVVRRSYADMTRWLDGGAPPAHGAPLEVADGQLVLDEHGNAKGGVRTPAVDAPVSTLSGIPDFTNVTGSTGLFCPLFGSTKPFDTATLAALYPTHLDYVQQVTIATNDAVTKGFIRSADAPEIIAAADAAPIPS